MSVDMKVQNKRMKRLQRNIASDIGKIFGGNVDFQE